MSDINVIGQRIADRRKELELKQSDLGQRVGTTQDVVSRWERGVVTPHISMLVPLAEALQTTPNWLVGYIGDDQAGAGLDDLEIEFLQMLRAMAPDRRQRALEMLNLLM